MHGHALSRRLYLGKRVQTQLDERAYGDMGAENLHDQQNRWEISPGELRCGGKHNPIRVDIYITRHLVYRGSFSGVEKMIRKNFFPRISLERQNTSQQS